MFTYTRAAVERAMKVQEVILRAMARKSTWYLCHIAGDKGYHLYQTRIEPQGTASSRPHPQIISGRNPQAWSQLQRSSTDTKSPSDTPPGL